MLWKPQETKVGEEVIFEEILAGKFSGLLQTFNTHIQCTHLIPRPAVKMDPTPNSETKNIKDKKMILKTAKEKTYYMTVGFSTAAMAARR